MKAPGCKAAPPAPAPDLRAEWASAEAAAKAVVVKALRSHGGEATAGTLAATLGRRLEWVTPWLNALVADGVFEKGPASFSLKKGGSS